MLGLPFFILDVAFGAVPCSPAPNNACSVASMTTTVSNAVGMYQASQQVNFGTLQNNQGATQTLAFTIGSFNPGGSLSIGATDLNSSDATFELKDATNNFIPVTVSYEDCAGTAHSLVNNATLDQEIPNTGGSMVSLDPANNATPPCYPEPDYPITATPGHGEGQITFTIPAPPSGQTWGGGSYADTITLNVTAN